MSICLNSGARFTTKKLNVTVIKQAISIYIQYIITVWNERDFLVVTFTAVLYPLN